MFKKTARLTRTQFTTYFKNGKRFHTPECTLLYTPLAQTHAAVVVGKKIYKKAHDRNQLRRRLYGVLYRQLKNQPSTGVYILLPKPAITSLSKAAQRTVVQNLLNRITIPS